MSYTEVVDTAYGKMLIAKGDAPRGHLLRTTGRADDWETTEMLCNVLRARGSDSVAFDIGANFGTFTLAFAPLCHEVHSFEPQRALYFMLCGSLALNGISNVTPHDAALGDFLDRIDVPVYDYAAAADFGCTELGIIPTSGPHVGVTPLGYRKVMQHTLDLYAPARLDMLKIDVEGMELAVLRGGARTILRCRPYILVEAHKSDQHAVESLMREWGYQCETRGRDLWCQP